MRVIYLAAPLSAPTREGIDENRHVASLWAAWALAQGVSPSCSWISLTSASETPENRMRGLAADFALVERCDEVWLVGGRISAGMQLEADHGRARGLPVIDYTSFLGRMPPGSPETGRDG